MQISLEKIFETPDDENHFFGYYDIPQLSNDNKKIITIKVDNIREIPTSQNFYEIFMFDLKKKSQNLIGSTRTVNFQQGCRAQWLGPDNNSKIIYNDFEKNKYVSKIYDINTKETRILPLPIYTVSKNGKYFLSVSFERLFWCRRGYSYDAIKDQSKNFKIVHDDEIKFYDIEKGEEKKIINIKDLLKINKNSNMEDAVHYIEHLMFSPCSKKFVFLHRYKIKDGGIFSRLFSFDLEKNNLQLILNSGRMSHFNFIVDENLLFYGSIGNFATNFRKYLKFQKFFKFLLKIYKFFVKDNSNIAKKITQDGYYYYNFSQNKFEKINNRKLNSEDGHPTCNAIYNMDFITDNYSDLDNNHQPSLFYYSKNNNNIIELAKFESIPELDNSPLRADLHPRFSYDGKYLSIDTFKKGKRKSMCFKVKC